MMTKYSFPEFDTSFWKTGDKDWMAARSESWPQIEQMFKMRKPARGLSIIKQYYLKGKLPDWEKLRDWNNDQRHVDLFLFVWLHPSEDKDFLIELRDRYIRSKVVTKHDIGMGFGLFFGDAITMACQAYTDEQVEQGWTDNIIVTGNNELYFDVMTRDIDYLDAGIEVPSLLGNKFTKVEISAPRAGIDKIIPMSKWLCIKKMRPVNKDMIFQYDQALDWWYDCREKNENYFSSHAQSENLRQAFREALFRIHYFDTDNEGDSCRTRFVLKMRKILDERPFIDEFEKIWDQVKSGTVQVDNAFSPLGY